MNRMVLVSAILLSGFAAQSPAQETATPTPTAVRAPSVPVVTVTPGAELTLDEAVSIALQRNETVALSEESVRRARAARREVAANGLPQVTVTGQAVRQKESSIPNFLSTPENPLPDIVLQQNHSEVASAGVVQVLDVFGSVRRARKLASLSQQIQELNVLRSRSEIVYSARTSYYNVLRAAGAVDVADASVRDAEEQLRLARSFVEAGVSPQFDVTRAEVLLADRQQVLIAARDSMSLAGAALNNVLGRPVETPVTLAGLSTAPSREVDIEAQTRQALEARPEILQSELGIRANEVNVGLQRIGNLPTFALVGNYNYNFTLGGFSGDNANWNAGVSMQWPLYQGGATRARVDQAESDVRSSRLQQEQLRRGVTLDVRQAGLRVEATADRFEVADKVVAQAVEALRLARARYQNGVSTQLEVIDAETALTQARFARNNALYEHLEARADFDASVMGRLSVGTASNRTLTVSSVTGGSTNSTVAMSGGTF